MTIAFLPGLKGDWTLVLPTGPVLRKQPRPKLSIRPNDGHAISLDLDADLVVRAHPSECATATFYDRYLRAVEIDTKRPRAIHLGDVAIAQVHSEQVRMIAFDVVTER